MNTGPALRIGDTTPLVWATDARRYLNDPAYREAVDQLVAEHLPNASSEAYVYDDPEAPTGRVIVSRSFLSTNGEIWVPSRKVVAPISKETPLP